MAYTAAVVTLEEVSVLALLRPEATTRAPRVVLVGGVPGAGKTTAIAQVAGELPSVDALDPEAVGDQICRIAAGGGRSTPRTGPLVHTLHALRVLLALLRGPVPGRTLVVHDPATRPRRRRWFAWLARRARLGPGAGLRRRAPSAGRDRAGATRAGGRPGELRRTLGALGGAADRVRRHPGRAGRRPVVGGRADRPGQAAADCVGSSRRRTCPRGEHRARACSYRRPIGQDEHSPNLSKTKESWDGRRTIDVPAGRDADPYPVVQPHPRPALTTPTAAAPGHASARRAR